MSIVPSSLKSFHQAPMSLLPSSSGRASSAAETRNESSLPRYDTFTTQPPPTSRPDPTERFMRRGGVHYLVVTAQTHQLGPMRRDELLPPDLCDPTKPSMAIPALLAAEDSRIPKVLVDVTPALASTSAPINSNKLGSFSGQDGEYELLVDNQLANTPMTIRFGSLGNLAEEVRTFKDSVKDVVIVDVNLYSLYAHPCHPDTRFPRTKEPVPLDDEWLCHLSVRSDGICVFESMSAQTASFFSIERDGKPLHPLSDGIRAIYRNEEGRTVYCVYLGLGDRLICRKKECWFFVVDIKSINPHCPL